MTLAQARRYALSLPGTREEPHFERTSFRVQGKIFATALPDDGHLNVFVGDELSRTGAGNTIRTAWKRCIWGGKVVGLRIDLAKAPAAVVKELLKAGWEARAEEEVTREEVSAFIADFEALRLSKQQWTHDAHLTAGFWYLTTRTFHCAGHHPPQHQGAQ